MEKYGDLPVSLGTYKINVEEFMFYQDMLVKQSFSSNVIINKQLQPFKSVIQAWIS